MLEHGVVDRRSFLRLGVATAAVAGSAGFLAGCGGSSEDGGSGDTGGGGGQTAKLVPPTYVPFSSKIKADLPATPEGVCNGYLSYPTEPEQVTDGKPIGDGGPISAFVETFEPIVPGVDKNSYWQELNKRLNIDLKMSVVPAGDYTNKFATLVAGGELPDMFQIVGTPPGMTQLLEAKCQDMTPYLSGDAIKDYPFLANIPDYFWSTACFYEGKIWGVPIPRFKMSDPVFTREDLISEAGLSSELSSWQDFVDLCKGMTDPSKNQWALSHAPGALVFAQQCLGVGNQWTNDGGKLTSFYEEEGTKKALDAVAQLVKAGYVHPDGFSGTTTDFNTRFNAGAAVMTQGGVTGWPRYYLQNVAGPKFKVGALVPTPFESASQAATWQRQPSFSLTAFKKADDAQIKKLLAFCNWLCAPFGSAEYLFRTYGIENVHWKKDAQGQPVTTDKGNAEVPGMGLIYVANAPAVLYSPGRDVATQDCYDWETKVVPTSKANPTLGLYSDTFSRKSAQLDTKMEDTQAAILKGEQPVSAWDDAVADWKSSGGDQIRQEFQDALQAAG